MPIANKNYPILSKIVMVSRMDRKEKLSRMKVKASGGISEAMPLIEK